MERRLIRLNTEIDRLRRERELVAEELRYHQHLNDDAQRDAAVSENPLDRADARVTAGDVARFDRSLQTIDAKLTRLEARRRVLLEKLG